jgi:hypothetical protein
MLALITLYAGWHWAAQLRPSQPVLASPPPDWSDQVYRIHLLEWSFPQTQELFERTGTLFNEKRPERKSEALLANLMVLSADARAEEAPAALRPQVSLLERSQRELGECLRELRGPGDQQRAWRLWSQGWDDFEAARRGGI